jgi:predicted MFS family arabinose efflux permease
MRTVVLGAYIYSKTQSPLAVGLITFAQLGPMLVFPIVGGWLTDRFDERRYILLLQGLQIPCLLGLAWVLESPELNFGAVLAFVLAIGICNALIGPAWMSAVPALVGPENLRAAVSLNSTQMNSARVIGPALGGMLMPLIGASGVILLNGFSFLFVIGAVYFVRFPARPETDTSRPGIAGSFRVLHDDPYVRRIILSIFGLALLTFSFLYQLPSIAAANFGMDVESASYGYLYACLGGGAVVGAVAMSTVLVKRDPYINVVVGLVCVGLLLTVMVELRLPALAYPVVFLLGVSYQLVLISLNSSIQAHVQFASRGQVMGLWMTALGGTVPIGMLLAGAVAQASSISVVLAYGAVFAFAAAWVLRPPALRSAEHRSHALGFGV